MILLRRCPARQGDGWGSLLCRSAGHRQVALVEALEERLLDWRTSSSAPFCSAPSDSPPEPLIVALERDAGVRRRKYPQQRLAEVEAILPFFDGEEAALMAGVLDPDVRSMIIARSGSP